jgi:hypothetical protein
MHTLLLNIVPFWAYLHSRPGATVSLKQSQRGNTTHPCSTSTLVGILNTAVAVANPVRLNSLVSVGLVLSIRDVQDWSMSKCQTALQGLYVVGNREKVIPPIEPVLRHRQTA